MKYNLKTSTNHNSFPYGETIYMVELINKSTDTLILRTISTESIDDAKNKFKLEFNEMYENIKGL